jgi:hypothetical protein
MPYTLTLTDLDGDLIYHERWKSLAEAVAIHSDDPAIASGDFIFTAVSDETPEEARNRVYSRGH